MGRTGHGTLEKANSESMSRSEVGGDDGDIEGDCGAQVPPVVVSAEMDAMVQTRNKIRTLKNICSSFQSHHGVWRSREDTTRTRLHLEGSDRGRRTLLLNVIHK